eukprot:TRINITY_DN350_c0_g1_i1.p2 TRINITY_DN350_c0_g1~~TRINITY_DN350_c0_g1_i1.p2  ORF type:complete len:332 (-),score=30.01 TRINITY_DN350_c0_g1_i1:841-1836(-)
MPAPRRQRKLLWKRDFGRSSKKHGYPERCYEQVYVPQRRAYEGQQKQAQYEKVLRDHGTGQKHMLCSICSSDQHQIDKKMHKELAMACRDCSMMAKEAAKKLPAEKAKAIDQFIDLALSYENGRLLEEHEHLASGGDMPKDGMNTGNMTGGMKNGTMSQDMKDGMKNESMTHDMKDGMKNENMTHDMKDGMKNENMTHDMKNGNTTHDMKDGMNNDTMSKDMEGNIENGTMPGETENNTNNSSIDPTTEIKVKDGSMPNDSNQGSGDMMNSGATYVTSLAILLIALILMAQPTTHAYLLIHYFIIIFSPFQFKQFVQYTKVLIAIVSIFFM